MLFLSLEKEIKKLQLLNMKRKAAVRQKDKKNSTNDLSSTHISIVPVRKEV